MAISMVLILRIIPARAGFTCEAKTSLKIAEDHPRSRGVYVFLPAPHRDALGSSPLARGLPSITMKSFQRRGIIPARAGFTVRKN